MVSCVWARASGGVHFLSHSNSQSHSDPAGTFACAATAAASYDKAVQMADAGRRQAQILRRRRRALLRRHERRPAPPAATASSASRQQSFSNRLPEQTRAERERSRPDAVKRCRRSFPGPQTCRQKRFRDGRRCHCGCDRGQRRRASRREEAPKGAAAKRGGAEGRALPGS